MTLMKFCQFMLTLTLTGSALLGCSSYYTPIGSKTIDIKSYMSENGKLTEVEPLFEKIVYEYEKENEPNFEFNEWKPKSLTHKGKLKVFWEEELNSTTRTKRAKYYFSSIPEGWQIWIETRYEKALDTTTGKELDLMIGGFYHSVDPNVSVGYARRTNGNACYNRESKEIFWRRTFGGRYLLKNGLYGEVSPYDQAKTDINDGRIDWEIKRKSDEYKRILSVYKSDNNLILIYANPSDDPKMGYDIYSFDPVEDKIVKIATIPSAANFFHRKNCVYFFTSQDQVYSVNSETYKTEYFGDLSQYKKHNDFKTQNSHQKPILILSYRDGKGEVLYNLETKKASPYFNKIYSIENEEYDINYYTVENGVYKGIDPETFEFTWSLDEKEICKEGQYLDIMLIDSRGILARVGDEKIIGLRP